VVVNHGLSGFGGHEQLVVMNHAVATGQSLYLITGTWYLLPGTSYRAHSIKKYQRPQVTFHGDLSRHLIRNYLYELVDCSLILR